MKFEKRNIAIGLLCALVLAVAGWFFFVRPAGQVGRIWTVRMEPGKFAPDTLEIRVGDRVTFENHDTEPRWPASNLHPTHGIYPEFDPKKTIAPGEHWAFTFDKIGSWQFHDHLSPYITGKIVVVD